MINKFGNQHFLPDEIRLQMIEYDFFTGFDSIATSVGKLGSLIPLAIGTFYVMQLDKKLESSIKASSDILQKDIKANSDASKVTNEQLAKDIKELGKELAKDIKVSVDASKVTTDQLAKDLKSSSDQLTKNINDLATVVNALAKRS